MLIGILGAWLAVTLVGGRTANSKLFTLHGEIRPALVGQTTLAIPPFGTISAHTHEIPLRVQIRIDELHMVQLMGLATREPTQAEAVSMVQRDLIHAAELLVVQSVALGALGALIFTLLIGERGWRRLTAAVGIGALGIAIPLAIIALTYRPTAFANPRYQGQLRQAPILLQSVQQGWRQYVAMGDRMPVVVDRVVRLYQQLNAVSITPLTPEGDIHRVLHISDLHNNPLGLKYALDLAREYHVELVVVTGDVTDLGHPLESGLLKRWKEFVVPVVVISGNHDSKAIMSRLAALPNVTVLDQGETVTRAGITFMGFGDPAAKRNGMGSVDPTDAELRDLRERILARLQLGPTPDVLLVHNHRVAQELLGHVPVILTGHSHTAQLLQRDGGTLINPGTTGAAGLRYFTSPRHPSYGAAVLHFSRSQPSRLQVVDMIALEEPEGNFSIRRQNIATQTTIPRIARTR